MRACTRPACWLPWEMQCGGQERSFPSPAGPKRSSCPWPAKCIQQSVRFLLSLAVAAPLSLSGDGAH